MTYIKIEYSEDTDLIEEYKPDVFYIMGTKEKPLYAFFICPCGCNDLIMLKIHDGGWMFTELEGRPTIKPSIFRKSHAKCNSHFWINNGKVTFC